MVGFDEYDRKARLTPGLLAIAPVAFVVITLGWNKYPAVALAAGIVGGAGAAYLLAILVRHLGRRIEPQLWSSWGGPPTTALLRASGSGSNAVRRDSWRDAAEHLTGIRLLSADEESVDPDKADQTIDAAVSQLTRFGQNVDYPLVKKENIQYGFERNFYGIRWVARGIAIACVAGLGASLAAGPVRIGGTRISTGAVTAGIVIDALFVIGWFTVPSADRIKLAADRYATQLLQAVTVESRKARTGS